MMNETGKLAAYVAAARSAERAGSWDEAQAHYEAAFSRLPVEGTPASAADLLRRIGDVHRRQGDLELAEEAYAVSLAIAEAGRLGELAAATLGQLALVERSRGNRGRAEALYLEAHEAAVAAGDEPLTAMLELSLGAYADARGDAEAALARYREALDGYRRLGDDLAAIRVLTEMGRAYVAMGRGDAAELCFNEVFELADRLHDTAMLGTVELERVALYVERGSLEPARDCCDRAFEIFSRAGAPTQLAATYRAYGIVYREMAKPHLAETHFARAIELAESFDDPLLAAEAEGERALVFAAAERFREALDALNRAHRILAGLDVQREVLDAERRLDRLEAHHLRVAAAWSESIEAEDHYAAGHSRRVAHLTALLAEAAGFSGRDLNWIRLGAFLRDVGKTAIPAAVLNKPGKLSSAEWKLVKSHPVLGAEMVALLDFPGEIGAMVRNHHERWDGTGYPDGLEGETIPLAARVLCVADVYGALTTARSYRPALPRDEALRVMEQDAGRVLDPGLFGTFRELVRKPAATPAEMQR